MHAPIGFDTGQVHGTITGSIRRLMGAFSFFLQHEVPHGH